MRNFRQTYKTTNIMCAKWNFKSTIFTWQHNVTNSFSPYIAWDMICVRMFDGHAVTQPCLPDETLKVIDGRNQRRKRCKIYPTSGVSVIAESKLAWWWFWPSVSRTNKKNTGSYVNSTNTQPNAIQKQGIVSIFTTSATRPLY